MSKAEHIAIMKLMADHGHVFNEEDEAGICAGVGITGLMAALLGQLSRFDARIESMLDSTSPAPNDLDAFFDVAQIISSPEDFSHSNLFKKGISQHRIKRIAPWATSFDMEKRGGLVRIKPWAGIYDQQALTDYLALLTDAAEKHQQELAILFGTTQHGIGLYFENGEWILINANQLPSKKLSHLSIAEIAAKVSQALLKKSSAIAIESAVYTTGDRSAATKKFVRNLQHTKAFKDIHKLTPTKITAAKEQALHLACLASQYNHPDILIKLHKAHVNLNQEIDHQSLTSIAASSGRDKVLRQLLKWRINMSPTNKNANPLYMAVHSGFHSTVRLLIRSGADVNMESNNGATPLFAAAQGGYDNVVKTLIKHKADVNHAQPSDGATPIMIAIAEGNIGVVRLLANKGADLNHKMNDGRTPASLAAVNGRTEALEILRKHGVDLFETTEDGINPLIEAGLQHQTDNKLKHNYVEVYLEELKNKLAQEHKPNKSKHTFHIFSKHPTATSGRATKDKSKAHKGKDKIRTNNPMSRLK